MAVDNGAQIINLSLGSQQDNPVLREAILYAQRKGSLIVAAVGNDGSDRVSYPAAYPGVIGVGANDANENYLSFSNRGNSVSLVAPGMELAAAGLNNSVIYFTGTSAAAPLVSGSLAHLLTAYPDMTPSQLVSALQNNANDAGLPGEDRYFGHGILNVGRLTTNLSQPTIDSAMSGFYLDQAAGSNSLKLFISGENRGNTLIPKVEMRVEYPGFSRTWYFHNIQSSQSFYETLTLSKMSEVIANQQEISVTIRQLNGETNTLNNSKSIKIRLNSPHDSP